MVMPPFNELQERLLSGRLVLLYTAVFGLVLIVFGNLVITRTVTHPLDNLIQAVKDLALGRSVTPLEEREDNELGRLAAAFNMTAARLGQRDREIAQRIQELVDLNRKLEITREGLIRSEKLAGLGQLAAGLAHELGNPVRRCWAMPNC